MARFSTREDVTQLDIARKVGVDVSSVNKILNRVEGAAFSRMTKNKVERAACELGYKRTRVSRKALLTVLRDLFPKGEDVGFLAAVRGISAAKVRRIQSMIVRA